MALEINTDDFWEYYSMSKFSSSDDRQKAIREDWVKLRAELAEAKKDAERYRWLRDVGDAVWKPLGKRYMDSCALPSDVDSAIDAAMRTTEESSADGKE
jgi:hypothetical protein